jgi:hypothetical protein
MSGSGSSTPGSGSDIDDPGRDPKGLHPPRDILDAVGGVTDKGEYTPDHPSPGEEQAGKKPDEPPTSTGAGGP